MLWSKKFHNCEIINTQCSVEFGLDRLTNDKVEMELNIGNFRLEDNRFTYNFWSSKIILKNFLFTVLTFWCSIQKFILELMRLDFTLCSVGYFCPNLFLNVTTLVYTLPSPWIDVYCLWQWYCTVFLPKSMYSMNKQ